MQPSKTFGGAEDNSPRLGVALSGGGVRASLFALGALIYLVDSRECERVTDISSVSGGSITNGFIAQRCDFQSVKRDDFDRIAAQLVKAITSGLVSKRFVVATYGFLGIVVIVVTVVTHFSWPFPLPTWLEVLLIALLGILLLLRGNLLAHLLQRQLFLPSSKEQPRKSESALNQTLGSIAPTVAHIFCATDLNASMPVYFTNVGSHLYSPAWGRAAANRAAQIRVSTAVRASAAFPGGIPPMRMNIHELDIVPTPLEQLRQWQQLVLRDVRQPSVLYLADGGVWNNLGTEWFEPSTQERIWSVEDSYLPAKQVLVVDAGAPAVAKRRLNWFWLPYIAEVLALYRAMLVSYTSTVEARVDHMKSRASKLDRESAKEQEHLLVRMIDPVSNIEGITLGKLAWLGDPDHWSGRWSLARALKALLRDGTPPVRRLVVRNFARLNEWTARVPTTLFAVPAEVALQLLIHGYVSTAHRMVESRGAPEVQFPGAGRFTKLLGLEAHRLPSINAELPDINVTVLGPISVWKGTKRQQQLLVDCLKDTNDYLEWLSKEIAKNVIPASERHRIATQLLLGRHALEGRDINACLVQAETDIAINKAAMAFLARKYPSAVELFSRIDMSDRSIEPLYLAEYADALARIGDTQANTVALAAEDKINRYPLSSDERTGLTWFTIAETYGLLGNADSAIKAIRESLAHSPKAAFWLNSERDSEHDSFLRVRKDEAFVAFEREVTKESA